MTLLPVHPLVFTVIHITGIRVDPSDNNIRCERSHRLGPRGRSNMQE
jgi:hypothetical protein